MCAVAQNAGWQYDAATGLVKVRSSHVPLLVRHLCSDCTAIDVVSSGAACAGNNDHALPSHVVISTQLSLGGSTFVSRCLAYGQLGS